MGTVVPKTGKTHESYACSVGTIIMNFTIRFGDIITNNVRLFITFVWSTPQIVGGCKTGWNCRIGQGNPADDVGVCGPSRGRRLQ